MGKFTHAWKVSTHGGVRRSSGCPPNSSRGGKKFKGIFKKRSKLYSKKKYSSQARCTQMARTKEHRVKQLKQEQHADLQNNYNQLQQYSDDLYNIIGQYLGHEEISLLREKGNLINDSHRMDLIQFKMLIHNVYKCNVSYTQVYSVIFKSFKVCHPLEPNISKNDNNEDNVIKTALHSSFKLQSILRYNCNKLGHYLTTLQLMIIPKGMMMMQQDSTDRNKRKFMEMLFEFQIDKDIDNKFKKCFIDGKEVGISSFAALPKNKKIGSILGGYRQAIGGDANALFDILKFMLDHHSEYEQILKQKQIKEILIEDFGEQNINFTPLNKKVNIMKDDNAAVNDPLYELMLQILTELVKHTSCVKHNKSNGFVAVIKALALLRKALCPDLAGQSSVISSIVFFLKKSKQYSGYEFCKYYHFLAFLAKTYKNKKILLFVEALVASAVHCRGMRIFNVWINNEITFDIKGTKIQCFDTYNDKWYFAIVLNKCKKDMTICIQWDNKKYQHKKYNQWIKYNDNLIRP
eukprot:317193_1